ncbi:MAG: carboxypeptidase regulatory-like domain-containing protein [Nanoarchaeota archaeon]
MSVLKRGPIIVALVLLVVLFFLLNAFNSQAQVAGCYIYPSASEDLYCVFDTLDTEAAEDCDTHPGCSLSQYFLPGQDCSIVPECELVTCSADCQQHALGKCQNLGGVAVPENQYNFYCSPGCCKISNQFCQFGLNKFQCDDMAKKLGFPPPNPVVQYDNPVGMTVASCNQQLCQVEVQPGIIRVTVRDAQGPVVDALVQIQGVAQSGTTGSDGRVEFTGLNPSSYLVTVTKSGFQSASATISLGSGQVAEKTVTLSAGGALKVLGTVTDSLTGTGLSGVTISWTGPASGQVYSDQAGNYVITELVSGQYTITASKINYQPQQKQVQLTAEQTEDFTLSLAAVQGVKGKTAVDANGNSLADIDEQQYGVKIYIDGNFRGYSQYSDDLQEIGTFELSMLEGEHTITATHLNFQAEKSFTVAAGQLVDLGNLLLTAYVGECTEGQAEEQKNVEQFSLQHVPGKKQVRLEWLKPCPEVIGYLVTKQTEEGEPEPFIFSPAQNSYLDDKVEWEQTYTYSIKAQYPTKQSAAETVRTITLGDKECEERYHESAGWETFCLVGNTAVRKTVYTCSNENKLATVQNCAGRDGPGENYFCSSISEFRADCQDAGPCNLFADPFGLYYSRFTCYGAADPAEATNFCYYDYTKSIVNGCTSCAELNSCFEYQSNDACTINNCLGAKCAWVDAAANSEPIIDYGVLNMPGLVTPETGHGYCVQEKYDDDDQCSRCSKTATVFENYYCNAQVCSALGKCFSDSELSQCNSCGDVPTKNANCYSYTTELECAGSGSDSSNIHRTPFGEIIPSADRCSWKRCSWQGAHDSFSPGSCIKDGDGDGQDDCTGFTSGAQRQNCKLDVSPPHTVTVPEGMQVISHATPNATFLGNDDFHPFPSQKNALGTFHYCLTSAAADAQSFCTTEDFRNSQVSYPGIQTQELVTVNLLESAFLQKKINGETYRLKFYSTDKYHNQENIQETFVFVDNVLPQFEINHKEITLADKTKLTVYLEGTNEPMACSFIVTSVLPLGETQVKALTKEQKKEAVYENLPGVIYDVNVTCTDNQGNANQKADRLTFDLEERIDIVHPALKGIVSSPEIKFRTATAAGARCELYKTSSNEKIADFLSDEQGKVHETPFVPGFIEGKYNGEHKIICRELLTPETYEDFFSFTVDFTPPSSQIVLREGKRVAKPTLFGWKEFFIDAVEVDFECTAEGFTCDKTFYCLGEGCYYLSSPNYKEYSSTFTLENSTEICYYSTDQGKTAVYSPQCGTVSIEGYGIMLEKPLLHYYLDEQWGSSNKPSFDWQFLTKVPTQECRFEFLPAFTYDTVPALRVLSPTPEMRYLFSPFPNNSGASPYSEIGGVKALYVKCKNLDGEVGPQQKMNLEYDPSPPIITKAETEPPLLLEGTKVDVVAETDDKTLCKYSDLGHDQYTLMNFAFPGAEGEVAGADPSLPLILHTKHRRGFNVNTFTGLTKDFTLTTMCRNAAGDFSELRTINFTVDYRQVGGLTSVWPDGDYLPFTSLNVTVQTSKSALCEWRDNGQHILMAVTGDKVHTQEFYGLTEKYHQIPLRCTLGDHQVEATSRFTIDLTPPNITKMEDGNLTCGSPALQIFIYTGEQNVSNYLYQIYDLGLQISSTPELTTFISNKTATSLASLPSSSKTIGGTLGGTFILNGSWSAGLPLEIPVASLNESHKYKARVQVQDRAGWLSLPAESDGVLVTSSNHTLCKQAAAPVIDIVLNESSSCTSINAELHYQDAVGVSKIKYGQHASLNSCVANQNYLGQQLAFTSNGWLCYTAENYAGKNISGSRQISFTDADSDGISDRTSCDLCPATGAGDVVDAQGCADGQTPEFNRSIDFDNDGLPDYWEKMYHATECQLDFMKADSNTDGIADGQEDYDQDAFGNHDEYRKAQDPCRFDAPVKIDQEPGEEKPKKEPGEPSFLQKSNYLAWILLIMGLVMVAAGTGYLIIYYYKLYKFGQVSGKRGTPTLPSLAGRAPAAERTSLLEPWKQKLLQLRKARREKEKAQQRGTIFREFTKDSSRIPHIENVLQRKAEHLPKLQQLAEVYAEHKEELKPGLRPEEKSVFAQLEAISRQAQGKGIHKVASKSEAQDLFAKLKELAKKRRG